MSFSVSMSFHTSLVVTRPVPSEGVKASPLRVRLFGMTGMVPVTLGWKSSTEKLVVDSWVFVGGGSGAPAGGSAIGPGLVPARYTTVILYHNGLNHNVVVVSSRPFLCVQYVPKLVPLRTVLSTVFPEIGVTIYTFHCFSNPNAKKR